MTITANDGRVGPQIGTGAAGQTLAIDFEFYDGSDLLVVRRVISTGVEEILVLDTDYTVTGGSGSTGTVTVFDASVAAAKWDTTDSWTAVRLEPNSITYLPTAFTSVDTATLIQVINRLAMQLQEHTEVLARCYKAPVTDSFPVTELPSSIDRAGGGAGTTFGFDASGDPDLT